MKLRRFNDTGLKRFTSYLHELKVDKKLEPPLELLGSGEYSSPLKESIEAEPEAFASRLAFARWLHDAAERSGSAVPRADVHFWAWLTLLLFDQVCPVDGQGNRKAGEIARYVLNLHSARRSYRHALAGADSVLLSVESARAAEPLLCGPMHVLTGEAYRLFVEGSLIHHPGAVQTLRSLYFDESTGQLRKGSSTTEAGGIRRLTKVLGQYARTYDLDIVPGNRLTAMLPREFNRWKQRIA